MILAHPQGLAISLDKAHPVAGGVGLEEPRPGGGAGQPAPDRKSGLGRMAMHDELAGFQRDQAGIAVRYQAFARIGTQEQFLPILAVELEPARQPILQQRGHPLARGHIPDDLGDRVALAHRVHKHLTVPLPTLRAEAGRSSERPAVPVSEAIIV